MYLIFLISSTATTFLHASVNHFLAFHFSWKPISSLAVYWPCLEVLSVLVRFSVFKGSNLFSSSCILVFISVFFKLWTSNHLLSTWSPVLWILFNLWHNNFFCLVESLMNLVYHQIVTLVFRTYWAYPGVLMGEHPTADD